MPASVKKVGDKYRVVDPDGSPVTKDGSAVDGGGHETEAAAKKQASAINANMKASIDLLNTPEDCDILELADNMFEKQHLYPGTFVMNPGKQNEMKFTVDEESIKQIASESQKYIDAGNQCNMPVKHTDDPEANRGHHVKWFAKTDSKGRLGLFSHAKFADGDAAKLAKTAQTSIYCPPSFQDGTGKYYIRAVRHSCLTDYPVIPGLDGFTPIAASLVLPSHQESEDGMSLKDLAANVGLQLSDDLSDEQMSEKIVASFTSLQDRVKELTPTDPIKVSSQQVKMLKENREMKLDRLVNEGNITPAVREKIVNLCCSENVLTLSLSGEKEDNFDEWVVILADNDPVKLAEQSGIQSKDVVALSLGDEETNPMLAEAAKRADAWNN